MHKHITYIYTCMCVRVKFLRRQLRYQTKHCNVIQVFERHPWPWFQRASARAHKEQNQNLITLNQQHLEHIGDECGPCTRAAGSKDTKGRTQLQKLRGGPLKYKASVCQSQQGANPTSDHVKSATSRTYRRRVCTLH